MTKSLENNNALIRQRLRPYIQSLPAIFTYQVAPRESSNTWENRADTFILIGFAMMSRITKALKEYLDGYLTIEL